MNCFNCQKLFDQKLRTPRLLIFCGHSLCESCCQLLFSSSKLVCPQCKVTTFSQKIQFLPKNLALIPSNNYNSQKQQQIKVCLAHNKKFEAFCGKEKILICIDCILYDGHKSHQMDSLKNSYKKQLDIFNSKMEQIQNFMVVVKEKAQKNKQNQQISRANYSTIKEEISNVFQQIKVIVNEQYNTFYENIFESFQYQSFQCRNNQKLFNVKNQEYESKLNQISSIMDECQNQVMMEQIDFLQISLKRQKNLKNIKFQAQQANKVNTFNYPKNVLIDSVIKSLNSVRENVSNGNKSSHILPNSCGNQKKVKSGTNEVNNNNVSVKVARKNPITSIHINQSSQQNMSKPVKKVSMKKQSAPISNQNSGITLAANNHFNKYQKNKSNGLAAHNLNINQKQKNFQIQNKQKNKGKKQSCKIQVFEYQNDLSTVYCRQSQSLCNSFMSNMTSFLSQKKTNSIYLIGGFNQESNNIIKLNLNTMRWQNVLQLQTNRSKFGAISFNKQIYLCGGKKGKERLSDLQSFSIQTKQIKKKSSMPTNRSGFGIINFRNFIFVIGGNDGQNILNTVEVYNIQTNNWEKKQSMKDKRDQLAVILGDNKIYAIGGFGGVDNQPLKSVEVFDLQTECWSYLPNMNYARRALSAGFLADGVYAIGGFDGTSYMKSVQRYQYGQDKWTQVCEMNVARCTHSSISIFQCQQIYVFGGFDYFPLDSVQRYSLITNKWDHICQMPSSRFMHSNILLKQQ